jgi:hypothetical protein
LIKAINDSDQRNRTHDRLCNMIKETRWPDHSVFWWSGYPSGRLDEHLGGQSDQRILLKVHSLNYGCRSLGGMMVQREAKHVLLESHSTYEKGVFLIHSFVFFLIASFSDLGPTQGSILVGNNYELWSLTSQTKPQ